MRMQPDPTRITAGAAAEELLARILYAEAGHRPVRAVEALASLAMNRARAALASEEARLRFAGGAAPATLPRALIAVLRAPFQFQVRHSRHPDHVRFAQPPEGDPALAVCRRVAARALSGALRDVTGQALHWHDAARQPGWALGRVPTAECGGLAFYRLEG
ncbi:cell wall hydrolase [Roseococcus sp. SYP-B2431]|uniref:cell wall hydrolase n=1 Tax=Roseococcus sp. SYP-B2431 TaxID=2496640 RepID=UPI00103D7AC9|nr:cell wall hydrolase [Roseococcus sp. SYP-B2431]TCH97976.1 cell wall hydrolase [Roseococcus sp. SYP-B2431]